MSIEKTMQLGSEEPFPQVLLELQQIVLGMFLIWDALGNDYSNQEPVERAALADWARKHNISQRTAIEALVVVKERYRDEPWAHYIHCRDFKGEGWADALIFHPKDNADVLEQLRKLMDGRPFLSQ